MIKWMVVVMMLALTGCAADTLHIEREGVVVDINIGYLLQDKSFKSLKYDTKTGVIEIDSFSSETSEVVSQIVELIKTIK